MAVLHKRVEQENSDLADVNKKFDTEFEEMDGAMDKAKEAQQFAEIAVQPASDTPSSAGVE